MIDSDYEAFLERKRVRAQPSGFEPGPMPDCMFDFQKDVTAFCLRQGRAALFLDTGLGKSICILEWCRQAAERSNGCALILTPLAVAKQFEREALKFGYDCRVVRSADDVRSGINVCNYDRLDGLDVSAFGAVALDESSILKSIQGKTRISLTQAFADTPYRLCATATPAPNDHAELGNHAEFLGIMRAPEMLARWFINDTSTASQTWRLKKAAVTDFWDWVASWARCAESPFDLGYDGSNFILPKMHTIRHQAMGDIRSPAGSLFIEDLSATNIHDVKRQTAETRASKAAEIMAEYAGEVWLIWTDTDYEADAVKAVIPDLIEVRGAMTPEQKEAAIERFIGGGVSLLTKPLVCGAGLNFQHCANTIYIGRSFSYESFYQSVRRLWRYGQKREVWVHLIVAEGEDQIGRVIDAKATNHNIMKAAMKAAMKRAIKPQTGAKIPYHLTHYAKVPSWLKSVA